MNEDRTIKLEHQHSIDLSVINPILFNFYYSNLKLGSNFSWIANKYYDHQCIRFEDNYIVDKSIIPDNLQLVYTYYFANIGDFHYSFYPPTINSCCFFAEVYVKNFRFKRASQYPYYDDYSYDS